MACTEDTVLGDIAVSGLNMVGLHRVPAVLPFEHLVSPRPSKVKAGKDPLPLGGADAVIGIAADIDQGLISPALIGRHNAVMMGVSAEHTDGMVFDPCPCLVTLDAKADMVRAQKERFIGTVLGHLCQKADIQRGIG